MIVDKIERIAKECHQLNKVYCETIGDFNQPEWEEAPLWMKESVINGVKLHLEAPNTTPEDSHINWMKEKIDNGWKYGKEKDPEKKEHPNLVPYYELPLEQKVKDHLFKHMVETIDDLI